MTRSPAGAVLVCVAVLASVCGALAARPAPRVDSTQFGPCDPLVPQQCMFPFPNNFWLRGNGSAPARVQLGNATLPLDRTGKPIRADYGGWNSLDGFSPIPPILAYLPNASIDNCPRLWNISASGELGSPTVLLDTVTGARVQHWVELDHYSDLTYKTEYERAFMMWPSARLESGRRYIVAIRDVSATNGSLIQASPGFAALRDGTPSTDPNIEGRRALFKDIFAHLSGSGVEQKSLQLAWDFTVGTTKSLTERMVAARDDAMSRLATNGIKYTVYDKQDNFSSTIARKLEVTVQMPWYLNQDTPGSSVRLVLDAQGLPVYQGLVPVNFTLLVPKSLVQNRTKGPVLQYGHGLFGSRSEVQEGYLDAEANEHGWILVASDWLGLSEYDEVAVALMLATDISNFAMIPDRCTQGMLNALIVMRLMKTSFANDPNVIFNGQSVVNPDVRYYDGNSQGGILGTVYMAVTQDVERGTIGVGGTPYSLLLPRSQDFVLLGAVLGARYPRPLDRMGLLAGMQLLWDRLEPSAYLHAISRSPLPNTPAHRILIHYGLGDAQVTWMGGQQIGRGVGAVMFEGNVAEGNITIDGFPFVPVDAVVTSGHVIVGWDFGVPQVPFVNLPAEKKYDTHEYTRRTPTAQQQMAEFFATGRVTDTCGGPCHAKIPRL